MRYKTEIVFLADILNGLIEFVSGSDSMFDPDPGRSIVLLDSIMRGQPLGHIVFDGFLYNPDKILRGKAELCALCACLFADKKNHVWYVMPENSFVSDVSDREGLSFPIASLMKTVPFLAEMKKIRERFPNESDMAEITLGTLCRDINNCRVPMTTILEGDTCEILEKMI